MTKEWIPNLQIGRDYDSKYRDADIHFDSLGTMADFFGRDMPIHMHKDFCQIHFILAGQTQFNIDQNLYKTSGPAIFYTPPSTPHAFLTEADAPGYVLTVRHSIANKVAEELGGKAQNRFLILPSGLTPDDIDSEKRPLFDATLALVEMTKAEWDSDQSYKNDAVLGFVRILLLNIFRLAESTTSSGNSTRHELELYKRFSQLLETHYKVEKSISFYCQQLNINESRLNYVCKKISGLPPKAIVNRRVILEAKRQITHSSQSLNELSYDLGYMDPSYFSRFFQIKTGLTPSEYKKQNAPG